MRPARMAVAAGYLCDPEWILCHALGAITLLTRRRPTSQGANLNGVEMGLQVCDSRGAAAVDARVAGANQDLGDGILGRANTPNSRNASVSMAKNSGTAK